MRVVGSYALHEPLGRGATASVELGVTRGRQAAPVAVKRLHDRNARDAGAVTRFVDEVRIARQVHHPNVVEVLELVSYGDEMLAVMEYVHGESLAGLLDDARAANVRVPPPIACAVARDVLAGLHAAHEARDAKGASLGIVHRDVTPENVIVGADGVAKLTDFGVAKAEGRLHETRDGGVRGKLAYLAPEQIGGDVSRKTDIYTVGLVLWEMLVLERPLEAATEAEIVARALAPDIAPPSRIASEVPAALDDVVMKALAVDAEARFATALELAEALGAALPIASHEDVARWVRGLAGERLDARARRLETILRGERRRRGPAVAGVALAALALALVAGFAIALRGASRSAETVATVPVPIPVDTSSTTAAVIEAVPSSIATVPSSTTSARTKPRPARTSTNAKCDPPWWIDSQGIRRYNPECAP